MCFYALSSLSVFLECVYDRIEITFFLCFEVMCCESALKIRSRLKNPNFPFINGPFVNVSQEGGVRFSRVLMFKSCESDAAKDCGGVRTQLKQSSITNVVLFHSVERAYGKWPVFV